MDDDEDRGIKLLYNEKMHKEPIEGNPDILTELLDDPTKRVPSKQARTTGAVIIICSMLGVLPPDKQKISPCAVKETWVDPRTLDLNKAKDKIKENIRAQYQSIFPRHNVDRRTERDRKNMKVEMDCSPEVLIKHCDTIRRQIRDDRMIFHYNGHGTMTCNHPKSEHGKSIWVVNRNHSNYTTVPLTNLMDHVKFPAIYVWDCDNAGLIVKRFTEIADERKRVWRAGDQRTPEPRFDECLHLAACAEDQVLPQNPDMPADLYTSCLTTPIQTALTFWFHQQKCNKIKILDFLHYLESIDGELSARNTMRGELDWILTAVLDCMAWQLVLDHDKFKELFRKDKPMSCLFRSHILADRIMRAYKVTPKTHPAFPSSVAHPLWRSWDLALDSIMAELSMRVEFKKPSQHSQISSFFFDQLTEFQLSLQVEKDKHVDYKQLPILLQMLMAQQYREETLELIGKFLDRGPYAVRKFIIVGLLAYIQRLIQNPQKEFKYIMVLIWAKVLATDRTKTTSEMIIKDPSSRKYFLDMLTDGEHKPHTRSLACFCLSVLVKQNTSNQDILLGENLISKLKDCLEELALSSATKATKLQRCAVLCLGYMWDRNEKPLWTAVRANAYEEVIKLLGHFNAETRAAAVYSLGTFLYTRTKESEHGASIEHRIANTLLKACDDGSVLVRKEAVVALSRYIQQYEASFIVAAKTLADELREVRLTHLSQGDEDELGSSPTLDVRRRNVMGMKSSLLSPPRLQDNKFVVTWRCMKALERDPYSEVRNLAVHVVHFVERKLHRSQYRKSSETALTNYQQNSKSDSSPELRSLSPGGMQNIIPNSHIVYSTHYSSKRTMFGKGPKSDDDEEKPPVALQFEERPKLLVTTKFAEWCEASFAKPLTRASDDLDPNSEVFAENQERLEINDKMKCTARASLSKRGHEKLDSQISCMRNNYRPINVNFHPFEPYIYIVDEQYCSVWEYEHTQRVNTFECSEGRCKTKNSILLNPHFKPFLCVVNNEAEIFIWRNFHDPVSFNLATAFRAFGDPPNKRIPIVMNYGERKNNLVISGVTKKMTKHTKLACWNLIKETRLLDIETNTTEPLTSMVSYDRTPECSDSQDNLLLAGFYDGTCRLFDLRNAPHDQIVQTFGGERLVKKPVVDVHIKSLSNNKIIYTSHSSGDMFIWDLRKSEYHPDRYQPLTDAPSNIKVVGNSLKAMAFHNYAPVMACGSHDQYIRVLNTWGDKLNEIKFHDGFMGQRVGPIVSLAFHPFEYKLVSAGLDNIVSVHGISSQLQSR